MNEILLAVYITGFVFSGIISFVWAALSPIRNNWEFAGLIFIGALLWPVWFVVCLFAFLSWIYEGIRS